MNGGDNFHRSRVPSSATAAGGFPTAASGAKIGWVWSPSWLAGPVASSVVASSTAVFFVLDRFNVSLPAYLICLSGAGAMLWRAPLPFPASDSFYSYTTPALSENGLVVVGVSAQLLAFDVATGAQRWISPSPCGPHGAVFSPPVLAPGNVVLVGCENNQAFTAVDGTSGTVLLTRYVFGPEGGSVYGAPALVTANSVAALVFITSGGIMNAWAVDGSPLSQFGSALGGKTLGGQGRSSPVISNDGTVAYAMLDVVSTGGSAVVGVNVASGATVFATPAPGAGYLGAGGLALMPNGNLVLYSTSGGLQVYAVAPQANGTGLLLWRANTDLTGSSFTSMYGAPLVTADGSTVFVRTSSLIALNGATGAQAWAVPLGGNAIRSSPVIAHGGLYVGGGSSLFKLVSAAATVTPFPSSPNPAATASGTMAAPPPNGSASPSTSPLPGAFDVRVCLPLRVTGVPAAALSADFMASNELSNALEADMTVWANAVMPASLRRAFSGFNTIVDSSAESPAYGSWTRGWGISAAESLHAPPRACARLTLLRARRFSPRPATPPAPPRPRSPCASASDPASLFSLPAWLLQST